MDRVDCISISLGGPLSYEKKFANCSVIAVSFFNIYKGRFLCIRSALLFRKANDLKDLCKAISI